MADDVGAQDPNPSGPGGLAAEHGQTETNAYPDYEGGLPQKVAEEHAAQLAAEHTALVPPEPEGPPGPSDEELLGAANLNTEADEVATSTEPDPSLHDPELDISGRDDPHPEATSTEPVTEGPGVLPDGSVAGGVPHIVDMEE